MLKDPKLYGKPAIQYEEKVSRHTKEVWNMTITTHFFILNKTS